MADCSVILDDAFDSCSPIDTDKSTLSSDCGEKTTKTSCDNNPGCCTENKCTPCGVNNAVKHIRGSDYAHCAKDLKNRPYSIPHQNQEGCIENADGSANNPISLRNMQEHAGAFKYLFVGDSTKTMQAVKRTQGSGNATLKYLDDLDAFVFVKEEGDSSICDDTCSDGELGGIVKDVADLRDLSSSEVNEGVVVYAKTTVNGETKLIQRLIDPCSILDCCKDISSFPNVSDTDTTYRAIWKSRNTGISTCECLELAYEPIPEVEYRKQMLSTPVESDVSLATLSISPNTGSSQTFDFSTLGVVQPSWANRVLLRVSLINKSVPFDSSNQQANAYVASGSIPIVQARLSVQAESDQDHSGDVSVAISGTGFQLTAGSGTINGSGALASSAANHFEAKLWVIGFEAVETA